MEYSIKRSNRKTLSLQVSPEGVLVRAPQRASLKEIERFVQAHRDWIRIHQQKLAAEQTAACRAGLLSPEEIRELTEQAKAYIPGRVAHFAPLVGVRSGRVTIRRQKTRWGSCSHKGNLNFNCLLMLTPPEVIDSVVVHELCHLKEMNHSRRFYAEVYRVFPEYEKWHRWLKEHGSVIMERARG